jgi:hypothetical protein
MSFESTFLVPLVILILGFFLKYAWDRWLSQESRITRQEFLAAIKAWSTECELRRSGCLNIRSSNKQYFEKLITDQQHCYEANQREWEMEEETMYKRRSETRRALVMIMMTQIKICEALKLDCGDLSKMLVEMGAIE